MHTEPTIDATNEAAAWRSQSVRAERPLRDELLDLANLEFRVVRSGAAAKRLKINSHRCTLGSGEGCTVRLNDPSLRAMHAVILRDASRVLLRAYTVPIEVNGLLVNEQFLQLGDTFRLGSYLFELVDGPQLIDQELQSNLTSETASAPDLVGDWAEVAPREFPLRNRPTPISVDETDVPRISPVKSSSLNRPRLSFAAAPKSFNADSGPVSDFSSATNFSSPTQITQLAVQRQESEALRREIDAWRRREAQWQEDQIQIRAELATAISRFNDSQTQAQQASDAVSQMRARLNEVTHEFQTLSRQYEISLADNAQQQAAMKTSLSKLEQDYAQVEESRKRVEDKLRQEIRARQQLEEASRITQQALEQASAATKQAIVERDRAVADGVRTTSECDTVKKQNLSLQESVAQSSSRIDALVKELEHTTHRLADARRESTEAYEKVSTLTAQVKKFEQQARAHEQIASSQSEALTNAQRKSSQLETQIAELSASRDQERSSWEMEAAQLQQTVEQLSLELATTTGRLATTTDEHEATRTELNAAYERLTSTRRELAEAAARPSVDTTQTELLRLELDEALKRPTAEQWQDVQLRLAKSEQQLEEARLAVNELQQQVELQAALARTQETNQTPVPQQLAWSSIPADDARSDAESTNNASRAQSLTSIENLRDQLNTDQASASADKSAYDWPTYHVESEPEALSEPPAESLPVHASSIDWTERLAMLRRDVIDQASEDESDESESSSAELGWGWSSNSDAAAAVDERNESADNDASAELEDDDSVAARLQSFTARDQRAHQHPPAAEAWPRSVDDSNSTDTPSINMPVAAPEQEAPRSSERHESEDESLGSLAKQLIAQLSQPNDSESNLAAEDSSLADDDTSRSIGSWMAASPLWGQVEEQERSREPLHAANAWSAINAPDEDIEAAYAQSSDRHIDGEHSSDSYSDDDQGGTMMMSDWPTKSALHTPELSDRFQQSEADGTEEDSEVGTTRQFDFQAQRYAVEEAEPAEPTRDRPASSSRVQSRSSDSDEEDSIEDYMNRLLQRVQGNSVTSGVPAPASAPAATDPSSVSRYSNYTNSGVRSASSVMSSIEVMDPNAPIIPRSQAPEDANNLAAMRELANASAKSAISKSVRGQANQLKSRAVMDLLQAGVVLVCGFAFYIAGLRLSHLRLVWFTAASLAVALSFFFVYDMFRKLAAARRTYVAASRSEQIED